MDQPQPPGGATPPVPPVPSAGEPALPAAEPVAAAPAPVPPAAPPPSPPPGAPVQATPVAPPPIRVPPPVAPAPAPTAGWQGAGEELGPAPGVRFASPMSRLIAFIVDYFVVGIVVGLLALVLLTIAAIAAASDSDTIAAITAILFVGAFFVVSLGYFPYFWMKSGQTPGMKLFKIRVVRDADGGPITGTSAVLRLIGYWISNAVFWLGFIWILVDKRRRGWHDLLAGTVVIDA